MAKFSLQKFNPTPLFKYVTVTAGICMVVLGVLLLAFSFVAQISTNILLYAGLLFVIAGIAGYIYGFKQKGGNA